VGKKVFKNVEEFLESVLAYPRRVKLNETSKYVSFKADDGVVFSISKSDYDKGIKKANIPYRVGVFAQAMTSKAGQEKYCESLNYGKPDFEE